MMKPVDILLSSLIPTLILIHLLIAPYTKVEESFNIQATHDIAYSNGILNKNFDHLSFPGAVPRTFVGALFLAAESRPIIYFTGFQYAQYVVRAVLGLFNAFALLRYKDGLDTAFGKDVGRWYILLQASQFHVIYYASRTLPNMFAFGLTTLAFREFLPSAIPDTGVKKQILGIFLFVFAGIVFRSEIALLLFTQLIYLLVQPRISLQTIIQAGVRSAAIALVISVAVDSYYWQRPIWPELAGFYYNAIQGKSSDWGISPYLYYFSNLLPRVLMNPLILILLIPISFQLPSTKYLSRDLVVPSILFVAIYSLQPHKESRFIIYVTPPLTAAASLSASYIWTRRTKSLIYRIGSFVLVGSVLASFAASTIMLLISSLNYPGGEALNDLHKYIHTHPQLISDQGTGSDPRVDIHMDVLSCMTGVTRFIQYSSDVSSADELPTIAGRPTLIKYDKTEDDEQLLSPAFWEQFDYALMEEPGKAIGKWEVVGVVYAYAGLEILRPGDRSSVPNVERLYAANNSTKEAGGEEVVFDSEDVKEAMEKRADVGMAGKKSRSLADIKARLVFGEMNRFMIVGLLRDTVRLVTGGWWVGPRMEPAIRILKRVKSPVS